MEDVCLKNGKTMLLSQLPELIRMHEGWGIEIEFIDDSSLKP